MKSYSVKAVTLPFLAGSLCLLNSFLPEKKRPKEKAEEEREGGHYWVSESLLTYRETPGGDTWGKSLA